MTKGYKIECPYDCKFVAPSQSPVVAHIILEHVQNDSQAKDWLGLLND